MSYRSELETYNEEMSKRKKSVILAVKIVAILLALSLVATGALVIVDVASDNFSSPSDDEGENNNSYISATQGSKVTVKQYSTPLYYSYVTVDEKYLANELKIDSSNVNVDVPGKYSVIYRLLDENGKTLDTLKITVIVEEYNEAWVELEPLVAKKAEELGITKDMSKKDIVKKVYAFVNGGIPYTTTSKSHTGNDRSKWEENWVKEALLTIKTMQGDCYSNYSLSKAFFEYFDIENVGIMRDENDGGLEGTHFWNVVNIGTEQNPAWYYYDATVLSSTGRFSDGTRNACLITLDKLWSYHSSKIEEGTACTTFYAFDPSKYPTVETTPLS